MIFIWKILFSSKVVSSDLETQNVTKQNVDCSTVLKLGVQGTSMFPLVKNWAILDYYPDYFKCHEIEVWDVVTYDYGWNKLPLIKKIMAWPWDKFVYNWSQILINDVVLVNSVWKPYNIKSKVIDLYAKNYPLIPKDTYLLLGDQPWWTTDSSIFWLIHKSNVFWKVKLN